MIFVVPLELKKGILVCVALMNCMNGCLFSQPLYALFYKPFLCSLSLCLVSPAFSPSPQQASYAASSFSSVSYCVQPPKVPFTPEDCGATQGLTMSVSNSFLSRHSSFPVHSVSPLWVLSYCSSLVCKFCACPLCWRWRFLWGAFGLL